MGALCTAPCSSHLHGKIICGKYDPNDVCLRGHGCYKDSFLPDCVPSWFDSTAVLNQKLLLAVQEDSVVSLKIVEQLVNKKADVNCRPCMKLRPGIVTDTLVSRRNQGLSPLMYATKEGSLRICQFLIRKRAHIHAEDEDGWTPIVFAVSSHHEEVVKYLIESKSNPQDADLCINPPIRKALSMQKKSSRTRLPRLENFQHCDQDIIHYAPAQNENNHHFVLHDIAKEKEEATAVEELQDKQELRYTSKEFR